MYTPNVKDGASYLLFQPWKTTMYGMTEETPRRWLRVVPYGMFGGKPFESKVKGTLNSTSGVVVTDVVTTIDLEHLLLAMSYGSTPHIETAITALDNQNGLADIYSEPRLFMTQAMMRNYESRLTALIEIAKDKRGCVFANEKANHSLIGEMKGIVMLWTQLMNVGGIAPWLCLNNGDDGGRFGSDVSHSLKQIEEDFTQLKARMFYSNFVNVPYKVEQYQRENLLRSYGIAV